MLVSTSTSKAELYLLAFKFLVMIYLKNSHWQQPKWLYKGEILPDKFNIGGWGRATDDICLDFCKVFDNVPRDILIFRLERQGFALDHSVNEELAGWQHTKSCAQRLVAHMGTSDKWCPLESLLGLILFSIFLVTRTVEVNAPSADLLTRPSCVCSGHTGGKGHHSEESGQA